MVLVSVLLLLSWAAVLIFDSGATLHHVATNAVRGPGEVLENSHTVVKERTNQIQDILLQPGASHGGTLAGKREGDRSSSASERVPIPPSLVDGVRTDLVCTSASSRLHWMPHTATAWTQYSTVVDILAGWSPSFQDEVPSPCRGHNAQSQKERSDAYGSSGLADSSQLSCFRAGSKQRGREEVNVETLPVVCAMSGVVLSHRTPSDGTGADTIDLSISCDAPAEPQPVPQPVVGIGRLTFENTPATSNGESRCERASRTHGAFVVDEPSLLVPISGLKRPTDILSALFATFLVRVLIHFFPLRPLSSAPIFFYVKGFISFVL